MITTHKELSSFIKGKRILHLNSLGKDSVLCLEWLSHYAECEVISVYFGFIAEHPGDKAYWKVLKQSYPWVKFFQFPNAIEVSNICAGVYQSPIEVLNYYNNLEFNYFSFSKTIQDLKDKFQCDFVCHGHSKYENFARASKFHKKGISIGSDIFPLGLMSKNQVMNLIKTTGIKLHPMYKTTPSTYDHPSWYKMRSSLLTSAEYNKTIAKTYPLLKLDRYRWERMMK